SPINNAKFHPELTSYFRQEKDLNFFVWVRSSTPGSIMIYLGDDVGNTMIVPISETKVTEQWTKVSISDTIRQMREVTHVHFEMTEDVTELIIANPMLVNSAIETEWLPAPEDLDVDLDEVNNIISKLESDIKAQAGRIDLTASKKEL